MLSKILRALLALPHAFRPTPQPRLIMTLLVKNEEELLAENIEYHHAQGVDAFIITDNNSTDRTPQIIEHYKQRGWVVESICETATDYSQKRWVDRMVMLAKTRYHADWVINADADEFWCSPHHDLKYELRTTRANVLQCLARNVLPEEGKPWYEWSRTVRPVPNLQDYNLSLYTIFDRQMHKVMHRTDGYVQISMGNHKVCMLPRYKKPSEVYIFHYGVRTRQQFLTKMINGGQQLEQRKSKHGGRHWRYFFELYKQHRLESEYDRVVGTHVIDRLTKEGYVVEEEGLPVKSI